jgi:signal peptidase
MPSAVKKIWNIITSVGVALVVVLAILLVGVRLVGIKPYTVLSGSMEPTYHVGSMIYVKSFPAEAFEVGDPVTFYLSGTTVATHRIIEVLPDPNDPSARYFRTQGDANDTPDGDPIHSSKVIGKPLFTVPYLGFFSDYLQRQPGRSIALGACTALLVMTILPSFFPSKKSIDKPRFI